MQVAGVHFPGREVLRAAQSLRYLSYPISIAARVQPKSSIPTDGGLGRPRAASVAGTSWRERSRSTPGGLVGQDAYLVAGRSRYWPYEPNAAAVEFLKRQPLDPHQMEKVAHGNAERILRL